MIIDQADTAGTKEEVKENEQIPSEEKKAHKQIKPKRHPFEKLVDDSIKIIDHIMESETNADEGCTKLISNLEKEVNKKEEVYRLMKLFDKIKNFNDDKSTTRQDTEIKNNFFEYKNDLIEIKNLFQNKKTVKPTADEKDNKNLPMDNIEVANFPKVDEEMPTSKKRKKTSKRSKEVVDISEIAKKIKEDDKIYLGDQSENKIANANVGTPDDYIKSPQSPIPAEANENRLESGKKGMIPTTEKKKAEDKPNRTILSFFGQKTGVTSMKSNPPSNMSSAVKAPPQSTNENVFIKETSSQLNNFFICTNSNPHKARFDIDKNYIKTKFFSSENELEFYKIKSEDIGNIKEYIRKFKNYMKELADLAKSKTSSNSKRKLVFIHDSFVSYKKQNDKTSSFINPRNPFKMDEYIIDYDKDSEEEFLEENAEDIKSKDNSDEDEDMESEEPDGEQWIVPDNHLSDDEMSEGGQFQDRMQYEEKKNTLRGMMEILDIRKNYNKPIVIDFKGNLDVKRKHLQDRLRARVFIGIGNLCSANNTTNESPSFPIKIQSNKIIPAKVSKPSTKESIKEKTVDIINEVHGSYMAKDTLIQLLHENYSISKIGLVNFFKDSCVKIKDADTNKKKWVVKSEVIDQFISPEDKILLVERHKKIFQQKEEERRREEELNNLNNTNTLNKATDLNEFKALPQFDLGAIDLDEMIKGKSTEKKKKKHPVKRKNLPNTDVKKTKSPKLMSGKKKSLSSKKKIHLNKDPKQKVLHIPTVNKEETDNKMTLD